MDVGVVGCRPAAMPCGILVKVVSDMAPEPRKTATNVAAKSGRLLNWNRGESARHSEFEPENQMNP